MKAYEQEANNNPNCSHLPYFVELAYVINYCLDIGDDIYSKWICDTNGSLTFTEYLNDQSQNDVKLDKLFIKEH